MKKSTKAPASFTLSYYSAGKKELQENSYKRVALNVAFNVGSL